MVLHLAGRVHAMRPLRRRMFVHAGTDEYPAVGQQRVDKVTGERVRSEDVRLGVAGGDGHVVEVDGDTLRRTYGGRGDVGRIWFCRPGRLAATVPNATRRGPAAI